ncbi:hypothetical protein L0B53_14560 [Vibrio sp. SS-MA-C1-2]|uniref:glycosyltransferase family 9 protein n=1 Tax=Vibrio sp. SS-MA-C1-2 TaxID=2908646 RepID=UPI001F1C2315|nr:glycosyltransferase family 9 protein [Vibrio sp. SS-MA-C1-2]UJF18230.1 hypothetical protein L0B53_14560 [Vibrio sp. SS-MA-C1-2]
MNKPIGDLNVLKNIKSIAILRWDNKLGDSIMSGLFINAIHTYRPDIEVTVIGTSTTIDWLSKATGCNTVLCKNREHETANELSKLDGKYDAIIELASGIGVKGLFGLHNLNSRYNIGYDKESLKIFNVNIDKSNIHFRDRYLAAAKLFINENILPCIPLIPYDNNLVSLPFQSFRNVIAINLYGAVKYRQFDNKSAIELISNWLQEFPDDNLVLIPTPGKVNELRFIQSYFSSERVILPNLAPSFEVTLSILSQASICFTPDTAVVHLASAINCPTIAIYSEYNRNYEEWAPLASRSEVIFNKRKGKTKHTLVHDFKWMHLVSARNRILKN